MPVTSAYRPITAERPQQCQRVIAYTVFMRLVWALECARQHFSLLLDHRTESGHSQWTPRNIIQHCARLNFSWTYFPVLGNDGFKMHGHSDKHISIAVTCLHVCKSLHAPVNAQYGFKKDKTNVSREAGLDARQTQVASQHTANHVTLLRN